MRERVASKWFGLNVDIGSLRTTADPYEEIARLAPFACTWQIKEQVYRKGVAEKTDLRRIAAILRDAGYRGYLPLETLGPGDPREKVRRWLGEVQEARWPLEPRTRLRSRHERARRPPLLLPRHLLGGERDGAVRARRLLRDELRARGVPDRVRRAGRPRLRRAVGRLPAEHRLRRDLRAADPRRRPRRPLRLPAHADGGLLAAGGRLLRGRADVELRARLPVAAGDGHRRGPVQADHLRHHRAHHRRVELGLRLRHLLLDDQPRRLRGAAGRQRAEGLLLALGVLRLGPLHRPDAAAGGLRLPRAAAAGLDEDAARGADGRRGGAGRRPLHADDRRLLGLLGPLLPELRHRALVPARLRGPPAGERGRQLRAARRSACPGSSCSTPST